MLRLFIHFALAATIAAGPSGSKEKPAPGCRNPDALYEEGRKDYNQKFTKAAIEKFEEAYKCSKNPLILYNIGLAYKRLYEGEKQLELLEKAKKALTAYVDAIAQDTSLGADPEEVKPILAEIDEEIERVKPKPVEPEGPTEPPTPETPPVDPGKKMRNVGIGLLAAGGVLTAAGVGVAAAFGIKGSKLGGQLNGTDGIYEQLDAGGCGLKPSEDSAQADTALCNDLRSQREQLRSDGATANAVALGFTAVAVVGVGLVIGGAVAFAKGKRTSAEWESARQARVRVLPSFGGLVLQGRF